MCPGPEQDHIEHWIEALGRLSTLKKAVKFGYRRATFFGRCSARPFIDVSCSSLKFSAHWQEGVPEDQLEWHWCSSSAEPAASLSRGSSEVTTCSCDSVLRRINFIQVLTLKKNPFQAVCSLRLHIVVENDRFETRHILTTVCN